MAINFYLTSIAIHNIQNYLILTMHNNTCKSLLGFHPIKCFQYRGGIHGTAQASNFESKDFIAKMHVRTYMIIEALQFGYSVLHSDIDVIFMKNPFDYINCKKEECDLTALLDGHSLNAGFLFIHPSAITVYKCMAHLAAIYPSENDQIQLNKSVKKHVKKYKTLKVKRLPVEQFMCGKFFYDEGRRYFADTMRPCPECVVVHNNWIRV